MFCNYFFNRVIEAFSEVLQKKGVKTIKHAYNSFIFLLVIIISQHLGVFALEPEDFLAPSVGPVVILPKASLSISYDDNVFLGTDKSTKVDDYITNLSTGIGLQYGQNILDSNYIRIDYSPSLLFYSENNELNTDNHLLNFSINYQKEGKFVFTGGDRIRLQNTLLRGRENSFFSALVGGQKETQGLLVERLSTQDQYKFEYTISPKTSVYISTSADMLDFQEEPHYYYKNVFGELVPYSLFDISNWGNTMGFGWQALPKIKFYGSLFYGNTNVESNLERMGDRPDSDFFGGHISANGKFSEKLTGRVQFGYQTRSFDELYNGMGGGSHSLPIFEAEVDYDYSEKGLIAISYTRGGNVAIENPNSAIESDFLSLSLDQDLGDNGKLNLGLNTTFQLDRYQTQNDLEYKFLRVSTQLTYGFNQWLKSMLTYDFELFDSQDGNIDYKVNRVMLGLSVGY